MDIFECSKFTYWLFGVGCIEGILICVTSLKIVFLNKIFTDNLGNCLHIHVG